MRSHRRHWQVGVALTFATACLAQMLGTAAQSRRPTTRDPALWPFASSSPWNTPLGDGARLEDPTGPCTRDVRDQTLGEDINAAEWSHPIYFAAATDPLVNIYVHGVRKAQIRLPAAATPAEPLTENSDAHLHIIDPTRHFVDEMWRARRRAAGRWNAQGYTRNDLYGSGVGQGGERAYGGSAIGGLIRRGELASGIRHALAFALPRSKHRRGPVWPANLEDDFANPDYRGQVPIGQLVALPRNVDLAALALGSAGQALARALMDYGAYSVDSSGDFALYAEPVAEGELGSARADLSKLRLLLRCVLNNDATHVGGGGTPVREGAPPLPSER